MKPLGVISTAGLLFVLLGAAAFGYPQHEQQGEKQAKHEERSKETLIKFSIFHRC